MSLNIKKLQPYIPVILKFTHCTPSQFSAQGSPPFGIHPGSTGDPRDAYKLFMATTEKQITNPLKESFWNFICTKIATKANFKTTCCGRKVPRYPNNLYYLDQHYKQIQAQREFIHRQSRIETVQCLCKWFHSCCTWFRERNFRTLNFNVNSSPIFFRHENIKQSTVTYILEYITSILYKHKYKWSNYHHEDPSSHSKPKPRETIQAQTISRNLHSPLLAIAFPNLDYVLITSFSFSILSKNLQKMKLFISSPNIWNTDN